MPVRDAGGIVKFIIAFASALLLALGAQAQECAPYEKVKDLLAGRYGEQLHYLGSFGEIGGMELWLNANTGTYSIVGRPAKNPEYGCLVMSGDGWRESKSPKHIPRKDT
jgi:hypothetical protein